MSHSLWVHIKLIQCISRAQHTRCLWVLETTTEFRTGAREWGRKASSELEIPGQNVQDAAGPKGVNVVTPCLICALGKLG
jgi:hypothetical protein